MNNIVLNNLVLKFMEIYILPQKSYKTITEDICGFRKVPGAAPNNCDFAGVEKVELNH